MKHAVLLRDVTELDLQEFYTHHETHLTAAAGGVNLTDRIAFVERWRRILDEPKCKTRTIVAQGQVVGYIGHFVRDGQPEISYVLGKQHWGKGLATDALLQFLREIAVRPLYARAAKDNTGSIRVLQKCGFSVVGEGRFIAAPGHEFEEFIFALSESRSG
jgi:RimJ/RimL family protein N-acetyltransferase